MATGRKRGRPRKPTNLKIIEGNPGKRPLEENEVNPYPTIPKCPSWLMKEAKKEWKRIAPKLELLGLLTEIDMAALAGYCQSYARWKEAEEYISNNKHTFVTDNCDIKAIPQFAIANKYMQLMATYLQKFGLSPSDRAGLVATEKVKENKSKMGSLLSG